MVQSEGKDLGKELDPAFSDCTVSSMHNTLQCPKDRIDQSYGIREVWMEMLLAALP